MADPTIVFAVGEIVTRKWGPCDDRDCTPAEGESCTAWLHGVADVLDALVEAGYEIGPALINEGSKG